MAGAAGASREHRQRAALILFVWQSLQQQHWGETDGVAQEGFTVARERGDWAYGCSGPQSGSRSTENMAGIIG